MNDSNKNNKNNNEIRTINPATEQILNEYEIISKEQVNDAIKQAKTSFLQWSNDIDKRADFLYAFAKALRKDKENLAKTATQEMGKPIRESRSEVEKCAWAIEYFSDHGKIFLADEVVNTDARKSIITFEPLGVIGSMEFSLLARTKICLSLINGWKYHRIETSECYNAMRHRNRKNI